MRKLSIFVLSALMLSSCLKHDFGDYGRVTDEEIKENVEKVFGTTFDPEHDWCTTTNGEVTVNGIPSNIDKVQVFAKVIDKTEEGDDVVATILNEIEPNGASSVTMVYDAPANNLGIYVLFS